MGSKIWRSKCEVWTLKYEKEQWNMKKEMWSMNCEIRRRKYEVWTVKYEERNVRHELLLKLWSMSETGSEKEKLSLSLLVATFAIYWWTFPNSLDPDLHPNLLTLIMFRKEIFEEIWFWKKSADDNKSLKKYPGCKELIEYYPLLSGGLRHESINVFVYLPGHVTIGGSICMEMLTKSGWRPTNDIEVCSWFLKLLSCQYYVLPFAEYPLKTVWTGLWLGFENIDFENIGGQKIMKKISSKRGVWDWMLMILIDVVGIDKGGFRMMRMLGF